MEEIRTEDKILKIQKFTFTYPMSKMPALENVSFSADRGEFVTLCGKSGCGKSTLLRCIKPSLAPHGEKSGTIYFDGRDTGSLDLRAQSEKIGFVMQSPDNQIVTDKVWHELAFGLENLGCNAEQIRARVAEMASFFGIQTWFHKKTEELSGGQKQILNLASVMVMQPSLLILDEPTSQLDPIAAEEFLSALVKVNRELGVSVILTEHRLEEALAVTDRVVVLDEGKIIADGSVRETGDILRHRRHEMFSAFPTAMRVYAGAESCLPCPVTVREGRAWLKETAARTGVDMQRVAHGVKNENKGETAAELDGVWFRYKKDLPDVLRGVSVKMYTGEIFAVVGGNGAGKSTMLSALSTAIKPQRGSVRLFGRCAEQTEKKFDGLLGVLPQNPQTLFVKKTVELDLYEMLSEKDISKEEKADMVEEVLYKCELTQLRGRHPYDLSGGEAQRAALAKILLLKPRILLLDEPTKGLDTHFKKKLARILYKLKEEGTAIVMVSHDIEFCARYADRCAMFFDGGIVGMGEAREFFSGKSFYTTAANRMARGIVDGAVLDEDIIAALGGDIGRGMYDDGEDFGSSDFKRADKDGSVPDKKRNAYRAECADNQKEKLKNGEKKNRLSAKRIIFGIFFAVCFALTMIFFHNKYGDVRMYAVQLFEIMLCALSLNCFIVQKPISVKIRTMHKEKNAVPKAAAFAAATLLAAAATLWAGIYFFDDRKYYFISMLIMLEIALPFFVTFEKRRYGARELVVISVLCAIAVAGRTAFYMLPQFKPVAAVVILTGVCFGAQAGALTGAISAFVSNFFFTQGPWTPWQMFSFGVIGFFAGALFHSGLIRTGKGSLCIFGAAMCIFIYGGIMNPASVIMWQGKPSAEMFALAYLQAIPFDVIHSAATAFFLWFASGPMIEKLERIKVKYGILE